MKETTLTVRAIILLFVSFVIAISSNCRPSGKAEKPSNVASGTVPVTSPSPAPTMESAPPASGPSLVSIASGAFVIKRPSEWSDNWSAFNLIDENSGRFWATEKGITTPQTLVIALAEQTLLKMVEFDNLAHDIQFPGCTAKDILVEVSDVSESDGFQKIAEVSLADAANNQRFTVSAEVPGRWVRLTVRNNHGSDAVTELAQFRAYGHQLTQTPTPDVSGTYDVYFTGLLHLKQEGSSVTGCYESRQGRVDGGIEGKAFKFTWFEKLGYDVRAIGPAVLVMSPDRGQFFSLWTEIVSSRQRLILGKKVSNDPGSCPGWTASVEGQIANDLQQGGRTRIYGINFDSDSDRIKDESKPTLDKVVAVLKAKPDWKITIEGHTDSSSTPEHNQELSERRAAAVKTYLVSAGINAEGLKTAGFGSSQPLATNDDPLGRAQNRRVELLKQ